MKTKKHPRWAVAKRLVSDFVLTNRPRLVAALTCTFLSGIATAGVAASVKPLLDFIFLQKRAELLLPVVLLIVVLLTVRELSLFGQAGLINAFTRRIVTRIQGRLFECIVRSDLGFFYQNSAGKLLSRTVSDVNLLRNSLSAAIVSISRDSIVVLCLISLMMYQDMTLAALLMLGLPLIGLPVRRLGRKLRKVTSERMKQAAAYNGRVAEVYSNIKAVKANLREEAEISRTNDDLRSIERTVVRSVLLLEAVAPSVQFVMGVSIVGAVFYGGTQVINETMSPGEFFSFLTALTLILAPVRRLASSNVKLQEGLAAAERIYSILDRKPEVTETSTTKSLVLTEGSIRLEGICFNYSGCGPHTLVDIDMEIASGRTTAIVGPTGAGKSTILDLLLRFLEPSEGRILIDHQDIRTVSISSLRSNVVLVSQEPAIFEGTVTDNIRYGTSLATEDDVRKVAMSVGAHAFISKLAKGYNTKIGTRGTTLSGGQRQLITIARAMLRNPRILLLDEPTASLDGKSEEQVRSALRRLMSGRTVVLIAHRLATVTEADRIYVLEGGKVIESGSHRELLQTGGLYSRLYKLQSGSVSIHGQSQRLS